MIAVECDCGKSLKLADGLAGKKVRCPECGEVVAVGAAPPRPRFEGQSPVLLFTRPAIEERLYNGEAEADDARAWQRALRFGLAGVFALALAGAFFAYFSYMGSGQNTGRANWVAAKAGPVFQWVVSGAFGVLGVVLLGISAVHAIGGGDLVRKNE